MQECPIVSNRLFYSFLHTLLIDFFCLLGIPKGLGASFKFLDKERDKLKDSDEWPKPEEHVS